MKHYQNSVLKTVFLLAVLLVSMHSARAQHSERIQEIQTQLDTLATKVEGLNKELDFSVSGSSIQEFVRAVGISNKINISIDPTLNIRLMNNFSKVQAKDIFVFLCEEYKLDIRVIGTIISIHKYHAPALPVQIVRKEIHVRYNADKDLLSIDLDKDSIEAVVKKITRLSGKNVILAPNAKGKLTHGYIQNMPFESSLQKFAFANDLSLSHSEDGFFVLTAIEPQPKAVQRNGRNRQNGNFATNNTNQGEELFKLVIKNKKIFLEAENVALEHILTQVCKELGVNYYMLTQIKDQASIFLHDVSFEEFLLFLLTGTDYAYLSQDDCYIIGKADDNGMKVSTAIQLQYRSVVDISKIIPSALKEGIEIIEFPDQNSLIVSGSKTHIKEVQHFVSKIDKVVPMVVIELLIVDNTSSYNVATGISAGIGQEAATNGATISPGVDVNLNAASINQLINSFNGFGFVNLGAVTPNFYLSLKAMESNGIIKVKSTPKLATLNGSEASLTLGNTKYYYEDSDKIISNSSTTNVSTRQYKALQANFTITINPIVSGDDQITLDITVDQNDFTGEVVDGAPPGQVTRSFSSVVRVKNQEMILLGGLEEVSNSTEGSGLPWVSRVPVLKWIFGKNSKSKKKSKLNIFIKPTVIY